MRKLILVLSLGVIVFVAFFFKQEVSTRLGDASAQKREFTVHFLHNSSKEKVQYNEKLNLQYRLYLADKTRPLQQGVLIERRTILSSKDKFVFSKGSLLPGLEKALLQMPKDSEAWVYIPWEFAFGEKGAGDGLVPPKHDLVAVIRVI